MRNPSRVVPRNASIAPLAEFKQQQSTAHGAVSLCFACLSQLLPRRLFSFVGCYFISNDVTRILGSLIIAIFYSGRGL